MAAVAIQARPVPVLFERSRGGGNGYHIHVGGRAPIQRTAQGLDRALWFLRAEMARAGIVGAEADRVCMVVERVLAACRRAEVTAEVSR